MHAGKAPFLPLVFRGREMPGYFVFSDGRIFSELSWKFLRPFWTGKASGVRYLAISICVDGRIFRGKVHRLVAEAYIGPCPLGLEVCHNDGDPRNNAAINLRYDTRRNNLADCIAHGRHSTLAQWGENNPSAKLTDIEVAEIRMRRASGEPLKLLAAAFMVRESQISRIANGKRRAR